MLGIIDKILILMASPILVIMGVLVLLLKVFFDGLPIFYLSVRYSSFEQSFVSIKFRSMVNDTDLIKNEIQKHDNDGFLSIPLSAKIYTKFGKILEKTQLVELPQFINCLKGDLYLVGARPLPKEILVKLNHDYGEELLNSRGCRKGGIAGLAQMIGKSELNAKQRLEIEAIEAKFLKDGNWLVRIYIYFLILFGNFLFILRQKPCKLINGFVLKTFEQQSHLK